MIKCKEIISIALLLVMLSTMFSVNVFAGGAVSNSNQSIGSGKCGENVKYSFDSSTGHLMIYGEGDIYNYYGTYNSPFWDKEKIKSIKIDNGVTSIGAWAFRGCTGLTSITIPESVTSIYHFAFAGCKSLKSVTIPSSVVDIDRGIFICCIGLESINVDERNPKYKSIDGVFFSKDGRSLYKYPASKKTNSYIIPNSVTVIEECAFYDCTGLTDITIPNSVTEIGDSAFGNCTELTNIIIPASVTKMCKYAFAGCDNLSVTYLGDSL